VIGREKEGLKRLWRSMGRRRRDLRRRERGPGVSFGGPGIGISDVSVRFRQRKAGSGQAVCAGASAAGSNDGSSGYMNGRRMPGSRHEAGGSGTQSGYVGRRGI